MSDSFFSARNHFDEQIERDKFTVGNCESLVEATTRRMVKLHGPLSTAVRIQRIADICAGAHVLPIEHWKTVDHTPPAAQQPAPARKRSRLERCWVVIVQNPAIVFWAGFFLGLYLAGHAK
jgi:hypothetical protein